MKRKNLFIIIVLIIMAVLSTYKFNKYPKKIVASIIYTIDDRILDFADEYFYGLGIKDIFFKIKDTGDYTFAIDVKRKVGKDFNIIDIEDATNKSRHYTYKKKNYKRGEKIINNEVYLYRPEISKTPLYIDSNTMKALSENSDALLDLGYDVENSNLFAPPVSIIEKNNNLKKYIKKEWNKILRSTYVLVVDENKYEIHVNSRDLQNLIEKISEFYKKEDNNFYRFFSNNLDNEKLEIIENLKGREDIIFYLEKDDEDIFKLNSKDNKYNLIIGDIFVLKIPGRYIYIEAEDNKYYNTIKGKINNRNFRMSYYPKEKKLIYHDEFSKINGIIFNEIKSKQFNFASEINGMNFTEINFNLYNNARKIDKEKEYIEILKLNEEDWNKLKSGGIN